jgi:hypothetical protein
MAAIYMWSGNSEIVLTTTLYPVDVSESVLVSGAVSHGYLIPVASDSLETTASVIDMTYIQTRWFFEDGPYDDSLETTYDVLDMTYIQTRWFFEDGPYDDLFETSYTVLDMTYIRIKVEADTPDEGIQLGIEIMDTCSMEAV